MVIVFSSVLQCLVFKETLEDTKMGNKESLQLPFHVSGSQKPLTTLCTKSINMYVFSTISEARRIEMAYRISLPFKLDATEKLPWVINMKIIFDNYPSRCINIPHQQMLDFT